MNVNAFFFDVFPVKNRILMNGLKGYFTVTAGTLPSAFVTSHSIAFHSHKE